MKTTNDKEKSLVFSYLELRKAIGILGIALPFVLSFGAMIIFKTGLQSSISSYYYTGMRDVLVGILFAIGFFLISYRGYSWKDDLAGDLACVFSIGVALFPTTPDSYDGIDTIGAIHMAFAGLLFFTLTYFSLVLFTKTDPNKTPTRRKLQRNIVYRVCGYIMISCIVLMTIYTFLQNGIAEPLKKFSPLYWLEAFAILAFGVSWFTKGEAILKDEAKSKDG